MISKLESILFVVGDEGITLLDLCSILEESEELSADEISVVDVFVATDSSTGVGSVAGMVDMLGSVEAAVVVVESGWAVGLGSAGATGVGFGFG